VCIAHKVYYLCHKLQILSSQKNNIMIYDYDWHTYNVAGTQLLFYDRINAFEWE